MWRIFPECVKIVYYRYLTWKTYDLKVYFKIHDFSLNFKTFLPPPPISFPNFPGFHGFLGWNPSVLSSQWVMGTLAIGDRGYYEAHRRFPP